MSARPELDADPRIVRYREREAAFRRAADDEAARSRRFSTVRLLLALFIVIGLIVVVVSPARRDSGLFMMAASIAAFVVVAIAHDRVDQRRREHAAFADLNREAQDRLARAWLRLPEPPPFAVTDDHPYATDLDLVGHASLVQLIGPPNTPAGRRTLADWLLRANDGPVDRILDGVYARQASVRELAPRLDERQALQAAGLDARRIDAATIDPLLHWCESEPWLLRHVWVTIVARTLAIATPLLALGAYYEWVSPALWMIAGTLGWVLMWRVYDPLSAAFGAASGEYLMRSFEQLVARVGSLEVESPFLVAAQRDLGAHANDRVVASRAIGQLQQIVALADLRHQLFFYTPIQTLFLWDFHMWWLLERWRQRHGRHLRAWLDAVGRVEAIASLASLAHDEPEWTFPRVERRVDRIAAISIGHPLLRDDVRVTNEVTVGPRGTFLLITGSNMSGKSTLLRAIGLNTLLALAGAPVCARSMTLPPVILSTSMRVSDSLERGLSLFMASLLRLQRVVEAARHADPSARPLLYLLDEVLQGTNSAERQIAVRTIVRHLVECGALGVVTTHDLELASAPDFTANAESWHLSETVEMVAGELRMTFDYKLRSGPATSGNALQLLRMLGLDRP